MKIEKLTVRQYYIKFFEDTSSSFLTDLNVIIYGAGYEGKVLLTKLREWNIPVNYFCDRDSGKSGNQIDGIQIITPSQLKLKEIKFHLLISIKNPNYSMQSVLQSIKFLSDVSIVFQLIDECIRFNLEEYNSTEHWFYPFCFDRVEHFSYDYIRDLYKASPSVRMKNGILGFDDCSNAYYNIKDGIRRTVGTPDTYKNNIYFLGDSRVRGGINEDRYTIASYLQKALNCKYLKKSFRVINRGRVQYMILTFYEELKSLDLLPGDYVLFCNTLILQSFIKSEFSCTQSEATEIYTYYLWKMHTYCKEKQANFLFFYIPSVSEIENQSLVEKYIQKISIEYDSTASSIFTKSQLLDKKRCFELLTFQTIPHLDFTGYFRRPHHLGEIYIEYNHLSPNGYKAIGDKLCDFIINHENAGLTKMTVQSYAECYEIGLAKTVLHAYESRELDRYLNELKKYQRESCNNGALVMNCNPFTNGHRYLAEYAANQVDMLYIFVVEEDRSQFKFEDRFLLVKRGVEGLKNVIVLKSGSFIISGLTMPEYFNKENPHLSMINCTDDIILFCSKIAPILNIKKRFVGEEPYCFLTKQYNNQMSRILPKYGIQFIEIPRLTIDQKAVSASQVRYLMTQRDFTQIRRMVPPTTFQYLICKAGENFHEEI